MEIPKLVVKVETEQQEELLRIVIPDKMAGRFLAFVGQQLEGIGAVRCPAAAQAITPASKG